MLLPREKISILLPTLYPQLAARSIETVHAAARGLDYEIVVVAPEEVGGPRIVWVPEGREKRGVAGALGLALKHASGDIVMPWTDDVLATGDCIAGCVAFFAEREQRFPLYCCGLHYKWDRGRGRFGTVFGIYYAYFPVLRRSTIEKIGGFYSPEYRSSSFVDADLSLRVWHHGGRCELALGSVIIPTDDRGDAPEPVAKYELLPQDMLTFVSKWGPIYGLNWNILELRGFNVDLQEEALVDHTFWINDPREFDFIRTLYG